MSLGVPCRSQLWALARMYATPGRCDVVYAITRQGEAGQGGLREGIVSQRPNRAHIAETLFCRGVVRPACRSVCRFFAAQVLYSSSRVGLRATGEISALRFIFMGDVVNKKLRTRETRTICRRGVVRPACASLFRFFATRVLYV
jgi:hypothetical protein